MKIKDQEGQILVESIIAISVGVIALTGVLSLLTNSIGINREVGHRFTANYLAMEGLEITKGIINKNYARGNAWNEDLSNGSYEFEYDTIDPNSARISTQRSSRPLQYDSSDGTYSYQGENDTNFTRTVQIDNIRSGEEMKVISIVEWTRQGGETDEVVLEDHFFDWRPEN